MEGFNINKRASSIPVQEKATGYESNIPTKEEIIIKAKEVLEKVDWKTLKDIFREERTRAGVSNDDDDFFRPKEEIQIQEDPQGSAGGHNLTTGQITMDPVVMYNALVQGSERTKPQAAPNIENAVFTTLVHEETHASGKNEEKMSERQRFLASLKSFALRKSVSLGRSGYQYSEAKGGKVSLHRFILFNEAVTDLIGKEVYEEYRRRTGASFGRDAEYGEVYTIEISLLESFLVHVANDSGISRDEIWKSIKQGYFQGLNLSEIDIGKTYDDMALSEAVNAIRDTWSQEKISSIISKLEIRHVSEESKTRILRGVNQLKEWHTKKVKENSFLAIDSAQELQEIKKIDEMLEK